MARRRMIDPNFWQSEDISRLSTFARLLFIGMFSNADDEGRGRANPNYLKSIIFPYDDIRPVDVEKALSEIGPNTSVVLYEVAHNRYYAFTNWGKWQRVDKPQPSQIPPYQEPVENDSGVSRESVENDSCLKEEKRREEKVKEKKGIYGEFKNVALAQFEYDSLHQKLEGKTEEYIDRLSGYIASKGMKYKSHYATILNWWRKDKPPPGTDGAKEYTEFEGF